MHIRHSLAAGAASIACLALVPAADAHSVPTHRHITTAAMKYLLKVDPRFVCAADVKDRLLIGTASEDDGRRPIFHFYPALNAAGITSTCSSKEWGFGTNACTQAVVGVSATLTNTHTWAAAIRAARDAQGKPSSDGWNELGWVLHLLEDLTSPAHTRIDPHPPQFDADPVEAETRIPDLPATSEGLVSFATPEEFFDTLQVWTQSNFYSKDTVFDPTLPGPVSASDDDDYFYDAAGRKIAYKSFRYHLSELGGTANPRYATIDDTIADEQFKRLGPMAVKYAASLIAHYYTEATPKLSDCFIDFEEFTGGSVFSGVQPPLTVENASVSGGQILQNTTFLPVDHTTVYGTAFFCPGCSPTITLDFVAPVRNFSMLVMNGQTFVVTYTVLDDLGGVTTVTLPPNSASGSAVVNLPSNGLIRVEVTSNTGSWDFLIDNIRYELKPSS